MSLRNSRCYIQQTINSFASWLLAFERPTVPKLRGFVGFLPWNMFIFASFLYLKLIFRWPENYSVLPIVRRIFSCRAGIQSSLRRYFEVTAVAVSFGTYCQVATLRTSKWFSDRLQLQVSCVSAVVRNSHLQNSWFILYGYLSKRIEELFLQKCHSRVIARLHRPRACRVSCAVRVIDLQKLLLKKKVRADFCGWIPPDGSKNGQKKR